MVDQFVELKRADLAPVQLLESLSYTIQQQSRLLLVIAADQLSCRSTPGFLTFDLPDRDRIAQDASYRRAVRRPSARTDAC